jgi:hypothetical protein
MGCGLPVLRLRREKLLRAAVRAFGTEAAARTWLTTDQPQLGGVPDHLIVELDAFQQLLEELESMVRPPE